MDTYRVSIAVIYRYLYRGTGGDVELAEDLTQATFIEAVRAFGGPVRVPVGEVAPGRHAQPVDRPLPPEGPRGVEALGDSGPTAREIDITEDLSIPEASATLSERHVAAGRPRPALPRRPRGGRRGGLLGAQRAGHRVVAVPRSDVVPSRLQGGWRWLRASSVFPKRRGRAVDRFWRTAARPPPDRVRSDGARRRAEPGSTRPREGSEPSRRPRGGRLTLTPTSPQDERHQRAARASPVGWPVPRPWWRP